MCTDVTIYYLSTGLMETKYCLITEVISMEIHTISMRMTKLKINIKSKIKRQTNKFDTESFSASGG